MTSILLIYPYFKPPRDRSVFRFPPLGVSYLAASLQQAGHTVDILDCTFLQKDEALERALAQEVEVVGIYCMVTLADDCLWFARNLKHHCKLLVAGGPLPTCDPAFFLKDFDVVVRGEGEQTVVELLRSFEENTSLIEMGAIPGIVYRKKDASGDKDQEDLVFTAGRPFLKDLDRLPFPARHLLPNRDYIKYAQLKYGYSITTLMSTRGCPYQCEFCSNVVFGGSYRERSYSNVVDEVEEVLELGYDRISFADDVFTLHNQRVRQICAEIVRRGLYFQWECLARVDSIDYSTAQEMKTAGCYRIYFGIESGDDSILTLIDKKITTRQARLAVEAAHSAGLEVGAFFILFYPGDSNETVLRTLRFANSLPLDYLGLSMPYPLPGTALYERVKNQINRDWRPAESLFGSHVLIYTGDFSESKMWFGIIKGHAQFQIKRRLGRFAPLVSRLFEVPTDLIFKLLN